MTTHQILICKHCGRLLTAPPEREHGEWVLPCFECGARNILAVTIGERLAVPSLEIVGLKWEAN